MANEINKTTEFFIPEVVASYMIDKIRDKMVFRPFANVDTSLSGNAGDTLTIPKVKKIIKDAEDVEEGAEIPFDTIGTETTQVKIKKIGVGTSFTIEALTRAYGNIQQMGLDNLVLSIANKIDNDCLTSLYTKTVYGDFGTKQISREVLSNALTGFGELEAEGDKVLFIHPMQLAELRNDPNFLTANSLAQEMVIKGSVGMIWGMNIIPTNKIKASEDSKYKNIILKRGALGIAEKKDLSIETNKDIKKQVIDLVATQHYTTYLYDESKIVVFETKAETSTASVLNETRTRRRE